MKFYTVIVFCGATLLGGISALEVDFVRLANNHSHVTYGPSTTADNSLIECVYRLDAGEEVEHVFWEMWGDRNLRGTYEWRHGTGGKATGNLKGMVKLDRDDGFLELTKLNYDLHGKYLCGVALTNGIKMNTDKEEVFIIDVSGIGTSSLSGPDCVLTFSHRSPAVFPEPTMRAGMYSGTLNRFFDEVPDNQWDMIIYPNRSVVHEYINVTHKIDENSPKNISHQVQTTFTKSNGQLIDLGALITSTPAWNEEGCPEVREANNTEVLYYPGIRTCHRELKRDTKATLMCKEGSVPEGFVQTVVMRCSGTPLTWVPASVTVNPENLVCVNNNDGSGSPRVTLSFFALSGMFLLTLLRP